MRRHSNKLGEHRTRVPSHSPMPGVDDEVIDAGATAGAQLPSRASPNAKEEEGLTPNEVIQPFLPEKDPGRKRI